MSRTSSPDKPLPMDPSSQPHPQPQLTHSPSLARNISGPRPLSLTRGGGGSVAARVLQRARGVRESEAYSAQPQYQPQQQAQPQYQSQAQPQPSSHPAAPQPSPSPPYQTPHQSPHHPHQSPHPSVHSPRPVSTRSVSSPAVLPPTSTPPGTPSQEAARRASQPDGLAGPLRLPHLPSAQHPQLPTGAQPPQPPVHLPIAAQHASRAQSPLPSIPETRGSLPPAPEKRGSVSTEAAPLLPAHTGSGQRDSPIPAQTTAQTPAPPPPPPPPAQAPGIEVPAGLSLHPEFGREGDVMVLCDEVGFMVHSAPLARASATFADALAALPPTRTITVSEPPSEMALLLLALVHGAVGAPRAAAHAPTVAEYLTLLTLYAKYAVRPFFRQILIHRISERALELAAPLSNSRAAGSEIAPYLRLAALCKSGRMWEFALRHSRAWRHYVNPWRMDEEGVAAVGEDAFSVLLALEALKGSVGEGSYTELRVVYGSDGRPSVMRTREPHAAFAVDDFASREPTDVC